MAQDSEILNQPSDVFTLKELAAILIKSKGIKSGWYEASINFKVAIGGVGPEAEILPGIMIGIGGVGLAESNEENPNAVDASKINKRSKKSNL